MPPRQPPLRRSAPRKPRTNGRSRYLHYSCYIPPVVPSLAKRNRNPDEFDIPALVLASQEFSGAEIEEAIISALYDAFYTRQELATTHVFASLSQTVPLAKTMAEKVTEQRNLGSLKRAGNYGGAGEAQRRLPRAFCRLP